MKIDKEPKPVYTVVVSHFTMGQVADAEAYITDQFKTFDDKVNEKIAEGYVPCGSFTMDHCDTASMDLAQPMMLK